jgi:resuscitation-promoting factor RpfB
MKRPLSVLFLVAVFFIQLLVAQSQPPPQSQNSASSSRSAQSADQPKPNCKDNGTYVNSKGQTVKSPETCSAAPQGATAQCRDGTYSFSGSRRGTCSHHGGVAKWL